MKRGKRGKGKGKLSSDSAEVRPHAKTWLSETFHTQLLCPHVWAGSTGKQGESEGVNSPVEGATSHEKEPQAPSRQLR